MKTPRISIKTVVAMLTDGERYIAVSPHLNIVGFGKSADEAENDFDKAVTTFFAFHEKHGNLDAKLVNLGWTLDDHKPLAPNTFNVPTDLLVNAKIQNTMSKAYATAC